MIDELFYATGWIFWFLVACVIFLKMVVLFIFLILNYYSLIKRSFSKYNLFLDNISLKEKILIWAYWPFVRAWNNIGKHQFLNK